MKSNCHKSHVLTQKSQSSAHQSPDCDDLRAPPQQSQAATVPLSALPKSRGPSGPSGSCSLSVAQQSLRGVISKASCSCIVLACIASADLALQHNLYCLLYRQHPVETAGTVWFQTFKPFTAMKQD